MEAKDLRIGNLVNAFGEGRVYVVKGYSPVDIWEQSFDKDTICIESTEPNKYLGCSTSIDSIEGILLTEEWYKKLGFITDKSLIRINNELLNGIGVGKKIDDFNWLHIEPDGIAIYDEEDGNIINTWHPIEFVHQLQNLYFALTGEELMIKQ